MWQNILEYLGKAVKSNTGISSLSRVAVAGGIAAIITIVVIDICMLVEVLFNHTIVSSLEGYSAIIASVAALVGAVGVPKAINNYSENKFSKNDITETEDEVI